MAIANILQSLGDAMERQQQRRHENNMGTGDNAKATIHFKNAGDKQLLLRFARFKVIE